MQNAHTDVCTDTGTHHWYHQARHEIKKESNLLLLIKRGKTSHSPSMVPVGWDYSEPCYLCLSADLPSVWETGRITCMVILKNAIQFNHDLSPPQHQIECMFLSYCLLSIVRGILIVFVFHTAKIYMKENSHLYVFRYDPFLKQTTCPHLMMQLWSVCACMCSLYIYVALQKQQRHRHVKWQWSAQVYRMNGLRWRAYLTVPKELQCSAHKGLHNNDVLTQE